MTVIPVTANTPHVLAFLFVKLNKTETRILTDFSSLRRLPRKSFSCSSATTRKMLLDLQKKVLLLFFFLVLSISFSFVPFLYYRFCTNPGTYIGKYRIYGASRWEVPQCSAQRLAVHKRLNMKFSVSSVGFLQFQLFFFVTAHSDFQFLPLLCLRVGIAWAKLN